MKTIDKEGVAVNTETILGNARKGLSVAGDALEVAQSCWKFVDGLPSLPNINFPTLGGSFFWNDLDARNGWRLQKNTITGHCRILDSENIRRYWGGEKAMVCQFEKIIALQNGR